MFDFSGLSQYQEDQWPLLYDAAMQIFVCRDEADISLPALKKVLESHREALQDSELWVTLNKYYQDALHRRQEAWWYERRANIRLHERPQPEMVLADAADREFDEVVRSLIEDLERSLRV